MINLGIAGLGFIGKMHLGSIRTLGSANVVAVADCVPENLCGTSVQAGNLAVQGNVSLEGIARHDEAADLLADPSVDAVLIALPTYLHKTYILKAVEHRKHILVEKPLALNPAEGRDVLDALEGYDRVVMVAHCIRFWPVYVRLAAEVRSGRYGRVLNAHFVRNSPKPHWSWQGWILREELSGGAMLDLHIHDVDFVNSLFGRPSRVQAVGTREEGEGVGQITATYTYPEGHTVCIDGGWCYPPTFPFRMGFRVACEKATFEFDSRIGPELHVHTDDGQQTTPELPGGDGYAAEFKYFVNCIDTGTAPALATPQSSWEALELVARERQALDSME